MKLAAYKNNQLISNYETPELSMSDNFEVFIGRSSDNHLQIDDPQVSREHALIYLEEGQWKIKRLTDIGTILINGQSIYDEKLSEGQRLHFGPFVIEVSAVDLQSSQEQEVEELEKIQDKPDYNEPQNESEEESSLLEEEIEQEEGDPENKEESNEEDPLLVEEEKENQESDEIEEGFLENNESFSNDVGESFSDGEGAFDENESFSQEQTQGGFESESSEDSTQMFSSFASFELEIFGEHAPYDKFMLESNETFIGRSQEKCQIVLDDHEVSSVHAKLIKTKINLQLEDLDSTNGTILNGARINKSELHNGDEFVIGSTTFTVRLKSEMLDQEVETLMPVDSEQEIEVENDGDAANFGLVEGEAGAEDLDFSVEKAVEEKSILKNPEKRKKLMYGLVGLLLVWVLLDEEKPKEEVKETEKKEQSLAKEEKREVKEVRILSPEEKEYVASHYKLGKAYAIKGDYARAIEELNLVKEISPTYENTESLYLQAKEGLEELERLEQQRIEQERREKIKAQVQKLLSEAKKAFEEDKLSLVEAKISKILEIDPENVEVQELKLEVDAVKQEKERQKRVAQEKERIRQEMITALSPGKNYYLRQEWYKAIIKLQEFLDKKEMDEDLMKEATDMLKESKENLKSIVEPLLGKARALKEGQDLKGAYEAYNEILNIDPSNEESLNEMNKIRGELDNRAKKVYREGIISESLSLFNDAKEKFQEVQQISPSDSEYYKKATKKLKEYLE